jgi:hypothetical protein
LTDLDIKWNQTYRLLLLFFLIITRIFIFDNLFRIDKYFIIYKMLFINNSKFLKAKRLQSKVFFIIVVIRTVKQPMKLNILIFSVKIWKTSIFKFQKFWNSVSFLKMRSHERKNSFLSINRIMRCIKFILNKKEALNKK